MIEERKERRRNETVEQLNSAQLAKIGRREFRFHAIAISSCDPCAGVRATSRHMHTYVLNAQCRLILREGVIIFMWLAARAFSENSLD